MLLDIAERLLQLGLIEEIALERQLLAAGAKAPLSGKAQFFFEQFDALLLLTDDLLVVVDDALVISNDLITLGYETIFFSQQGLQFGRRQRREIRERLALIGRCLHADIITKQRSE